MDADVGCRCSDMRRRLLCSVGRQRRGSGFAEAQGAPAAWLCLRGLLRKWGMRVGGGSGMRRLRVQMVVLFDRIYRMDRIRSALGLFFLVSLRAVF